MKRLFDDPALPAELRADLLRSRRAGENYDALAKLPLLRSALLDAAQQPSDVSASDTSRQTWPRLDVAPWTWKLAVIAALAGGAMLAWPAQRAARSERPAVTKPQGAAATTIATEPKQPVQAVIPTPTRVAVPTQLAPIPASPAHSSRREIAQLVRIRAMLERDPAAAYRLAQRSEQEFPEGALSEERQALQVLALVKSGAAEPAAQKAREFLVRYPESPMRELLRSALNR